MKQRKPDAGPRGAPRGGGRKGLAGDGPIDERARSARPTVAGEARRARLTSPARGGEDDAFRLLVEPLRPELHAHCRQMLGSPHDAEDAVQDTLLRAWRGLPRFESRGSLRSWLYRIATNTCLDALAGRRRRPASWHHTRPADPGAPPFEPAWPEPDPDRGMCSVGAPLTPEERYERRESLELGVIAVLRHLPSRQRAVLILREVLGFSAKETAVVLGTTVTSVNSALQRTRRALATCPPTQSHQAAVRAGGDWCLRGIVERWLNALEEGDAAGIVALLIEDASVAAPADGASAPPPINVRTARRRPSATGAAA